LDNKVIDIIDAGYNHEEHDSSFYAGDMVRTG